eukprot:342077-Rhodomonas_salina.2
MATVPIGPVTLTARLAAQPSTSRTISSSSWSRPRPSKMAGRRRYRAFCASSASALRPLVLRPCCNYDTGRCTWGRAYSTELAHVGAGWRAPTGAAAVQRPAVPGPSHAPCHRALRRAVRYGDGVCCCVLCGAELAYGAMRRRFWC